MLGVHQALCCCHRFQLTPCLCKGDQKYVHKSCLQKWQRSVLVSQPTHPAFYQRDVRQEVCNVCKGTFDPPPPPRAELMAGFTGAELASLLREGVLIVTEPRTSRQMAQTLRTMRGAGSLRHWIKGIYLITSVGEGSATDGGDRITAVNLTRQIDGDELPPQLLRLAQRLSTRRPVATDEDGEEAEEEDDEEEAAAAAVVTAANAEEEAMPPPPAADVTLSLTHYLGGPCLQFKPTGLALLRDPAAMDAAQEISSSVTLGPTPGAVQAAGGDTPQAAAADDADGAAAGADEWEDGGRWVSGELGAVCALVRGEARRLHQTAANVKVIWGDARWSRAQLLGELARGHWGMCTAAVHDVFAAEAGPAQWEALVARENERIVYAPRSEMTEEMDDDEEDPDEAEDDEGGEERDDD